MVKFVLSREEENKININFIEIIPSSKNKEDKRVKNKINSFHQLFLQLFTKLVEKVKI